MAVLGPACRVYASTSRRVTLGANNMSPEATVWTAAMSRSGGVSLSRKPDAPARSAW
ncbi:hypothetical protein [Nonomuraea sp. CA-141351]|uniref:hypothetical protein n=1 Tax=Nonomuraea sp. CA-141351 TaxID=3239996 RepID=UPI003D89FE40